MPFTGERTPKTAGWGDGVRGTSWGMLGLRQEGEGSSSSTMYYLLKPSWAILLQPLSSSLKAWRVSRLGYRSKDSAFMSKSC